MKTMTKIIGILGIALIAITTIGAVSATDEYFIYDGTSDTASCNDLTRDQIDELLNEIGGNQNIGGTEKIIVGINHDCDDDCDSASETHDDPSADHTDDHSDSESKNINTGLNRDRF